MSCLPGASVGIWKMIKSNEDLLALQRVMKLPIPGWRATELIQPILCDDNLCDHFIAVCALNKEADIRSLVVNRIDQLYFTDIPAEDICHVDIASALRAFVDSFSPAEDDIFFALQTIRNDIEARRPVMWLCDDLEGDQQTYTVKRDAIGLDYVVIAPDDKIYRVEAIHACVLAFHPENAQRYQPGGPSSLTIR